MCLFTHRASQGAFRRLHITHFLRVYYVPTENWPLVVVSAGLCDGAFASGWLCVYLSVSLQIYRILGKTVVCYPIIFDLSDFYMSQDVLLLIDDIKVAEHFHPQGTAVLANFLLGPGPRPGTLLPEAGAPLRLQETPWSGCQWICSA